MKYSYIQYVRGESKIKLKKANKKGTVTVRRVIIFKGSIADLITLLSSSVQNSELKAVAMATAAIVVIILNFNVPPPTAALKVTQV